MQHKKTSEHQHHDRYNYNLEIEEVLEAAGSSWEGLTDHEAAKRLAQYGPNALPITKPSLLKRLVEPFANAFVVVLLIALALSLLEHKTVDATIIGIIVGVNAIIYYFQQYSVGQVLKTLKNSDVATADVRRGGKVQRIDGDELTYGDIIHISEGMKVPADGRLIECNQVQADEALLTGESLPVHKQAAAIDGERRVYDQSNMLFKGTYIKAGSGLLLVTGIGADTELGGITKLAGQADSGRSPIEYKIDQLTKRLVMIIAGIAVVALGLAVLRGIGIEEALRFSLVLVVSAVPEGLPVALTIVLLLSARRMARVNALVKRISSIETMGAVTLIATDKTGTITQNKLSVAAKHTTHGSAHTFDEVIRASLNGSGDHQDDPLDTILGESVKRIRIPASWQKMRDFAFNQHLRLSGALWKHGKGYTLYIKGAPEHILSHCSVRHQRDEKVRQALEHFAGQGYRVIAFAHKDFHRSTDKLTASGLRDMVFDGYVGLSDTLRPGVEKAVAEAHAAGINVVMLTGDHVATAGYIAQRVGIAKGPGDVSDSTVLASAQPEAIRTSLRLSTVFGRVLPEHKYALLQATKHREITAMTGDGVNDIPALVEADAGIAMGSGTDAAKDASDIVLLDNNFGTIVQAVKIGRTALANIRKMLVYLLGTSGGEVLTMLTALVLGIPIPVAAIQILWINLVTDGVSVIPLGLSPAEPRHMQQPPADPKAGLLNFKLVSRVALMATVMAATVLVIFKLNLPKGYEYAQTLAFLALITIQWANAFNINFEYQSFFRNFTHPNPKLWGAIGFSIILQLLVFMTPLGQALHVVPVAWQDAAVAIIVPVTIALIVVDLHKLAFYLFRRK